MGKPRLIILIRHAQSEGNKNREIHQMIPDHRVKLTDDGWRQAEEAGRRLRTLLTPDDTLQIYTSPYRRTRETTEAILSTLTAAPTPSPTHPDHDAESQAPPPPPFSRSKIKVYEEPRLREQDFGNFQPCSAEMERMWQERADYGHFFYRIPNGESAADAYDRISGFNESLWRSFGEEDFPSVCVLVTHGLMTRVFLMKWYHWSVEYFEDLRNINHCEFITMQQDLANGKFRLDTQLRTWSELKRQKAEEARNNPQRRNTLSHFLTKEQQGQGSPKIPPRKWGGCIGGCDHGHERYPRRGEEGKEKVAGGGVPEVSLPPAHVEGAEGDSNEANDSPGGAPEPAPTMFADGAAEEGPPRSASHPVGSTSQATPLRPATYLQPGRDGGGSGANTPHEMSDDEEYFNDQQPSSTTALPRPKAMAKVMRRPQRKPTTEDIERWASESGMGRGKQADALGDEPSAEEFEDDDGAQGVERKVGEEVLEEVRRAEKEDRSLRGSVY